MSPSPTHPRGDAGHAHALLHRLKDFGHVVDLILAPRAPVDAEALRATRAAWNRVVLVPQARGDEGEGDGRLSPAVESALRALVAGSAYDVVLALDPGFGRGLDVVPDGPVRVLQATGLDGTGANRPARTYGFASADLVLIGNEDGRDFMRAMTGKPVIVLGPPVGRGTRPYRDGRRIGILGDSSAARDVSRFVASTDLDHLAGEGGVLRVGGPVAGRIGGVRRGLELVTDGTFALDNLHLLVCPGETVPDTAVAALGRGLPVIGTAAAFRGLPTRAAYHAAPDAVGVAAFVRRWLASDGLRRAVAVESAALAARHAAEVERRYDVFRSLASLRAALRRPRILAVTGTATRRFSDVVEAVGAAMDVRVLLLNAPAGSEGLPGSAIRRASRGEPAMPVTDSAAALDATRAALAAERHDALLLGDDDLSFLRAAAGDDVVTILDAAPDAPGAVPALDRCGRLAAFDLLLTRSPGQQRAMRRALPAHAWYLPPSCAELPCPDRARPVRRVVIAADGTRAEVSCLRWFLDQVWPALMPEGLECLVLGDAGEALPRPLPERVILRDGDGGDPLGSADLALNLVTDADTTHLTHDYLLRGLPCVLSEAAADDIGGGEGEAFLVARSRAECVAHLQRLAHDADWRRAVGEAAFRLGRARFGRPHAASAARGVADLVSSRAA